MSRQVLCPPRARTRALFLVAFLCATACTSVQRLSAQGVATEERNRGVVVHARWKHATGTVDQLRAGCQRDGEDAARKQAFPEVSVRRQRLLGLAATACFAGIAACHATASSASFNGEAYPRIVLYHRDCVAAEVIEGAGVLRARGFTVTQIETTVMDVRPGRCMGLPDLSTKQLVRMGRDLHVDAVFALRVNTSERSASPRLEGEPRPIVSDRLLGFVRDTFVTAELRMIDTRTGKVIWHASADVAAGSHPTATAARDVFPKVPQRPGSEHDE